MADINAAPDDDQKLISKILDRKRKTDLRGLLRAQREGRLDEYIAKDLAKAKRKKKKGSTRVRSVSCAPMSSSKAYTKLESKQDPSWSREPKPSPAKTRPRARSTKPKPAVLTTTRQRAISTKPSSSGAADHKTNAMQTFLAKEKQSNSSTKRKQQKKTRSKSLAPISGSTSTKEINRSTEKKSKELPLRKSHESVGLKKSLLSVVNEKPRSKSFGGGKKKISAMQKFRNMEKQNQPKTKRKKKSGKNKASHGFEQGGRTRSQSCFPSTEVKTNRPMKKSIKEKASLFDSEEAKSEADVNELLVIKRKTMNLASKALKKIPGSQIFVEKKDTNS